MDNQLKPILCETETDTNTLHSDSENNTVHPSITKFTGEQRNDTVIDTQVQTTQKLFRQSDETFVPDFSDRQSISSVEIKTPDDVQYHCISTRGDKTQNNPICRPETIENIIRKLDVPEELTVVNVSDEHKEYITKSKFSTLIGEMRVDILSMINLLSMMSKDSSASNEEIQNIKRDICNIINENTKLKDKVTKTKDDADKRLLHVCKTYNDKIEELTARLDRIDVEHNSTNDVKLSQDIRVIRKTRNAPVLETKQESKQEQKQDLQAQNAEIEPSVVNRQMSRQAARLAATQTLNPVVNQENNQTSVKASNQTRNQEIVNVKKQESDDESESDSESEKEPERISKNKPTSNSITDSNMDKNVAKFKVVPARSKKSGPDSFGIVEKQPDEPVFSGNFRQVARRDNIENKSKVMTDTKTSRANRLGLQTHMSVADKVSVRRR